MLWEHGQLSEIDCLISDIGMPDMDGFELRRLALAERPGLPVILITGRPDLRTHHVSTVQDGRFFEKPFDGQQLLAAVRTALATASGAGG
jgi:FixJ family two-component response regulator